jgi:hypothetical protein
MRRRDGYELPEDMDELEFALLVWGKNCQVRFSFPAQPAPSPIPFVLNGADTTVPPVSLAGMRRLGELPDYPLPLPQASLYSLSLEKVRNSFP